MQELDLNFKVDNNEQAIIENAISTIIEKEVSKTNNLSYWTDIKVNFDDKNKIIEIINLASDPKLNACDQDWSGHKTKSNQNFINAIRFLQTLQIDLTFTTSNGVFKPIIHENTNAKKIKYCLFNNIESNEEETNNNQHTVITIKNFPVQLDLAKLIKTIKLNFAFLQDWKRKIPTKYGYVLIPNKNCSHAIYVKGIRNEIFSKNNLFDERFTLAYDFAEESFPVPYFYSFWGEKMSDLLKKSLESLPKKDKLIIYRDLLSNYSSNEWFYLAKKDILKWVNKFAPNDYLLDDDDHDIETGRDRLSDYKDIIKQANKTIISSYEPDDLPSNCQIKTSNEFIDEYELNHCKKYFALNDLTSKQRLNWLTWLAFWDYTSKTDLNIGDGLKKAQITKIDFKISKLQKTKYLVIKKSQLIIIDLSCLDDIYDLMVKIQEAINDLMYDPGWNFDCSCYNQSDWQHALYDYLVYIYKSKLN